MIWWVCYAVGFTALVGAIAWFSARRNRRRAYALRAGTLVLLNADGTVRAATREDAAAIVGVVKQVNEDGTVWVEIGNGWRKP